MGNSACCTCTALPSQAFSASSSSAGTSDEHLSIVQYLATSKVDGAVIVTTPQELSLLDVRKEISFCRKVLPPRVFRCRLAVFQ